MKRLLKLAISLFVHVSDMFYEAFCSLLGRQMPPRCVVLYYHTVPAEFRNLFARQMDFLLEHAQPISTASPSALAHGKHYVCVTFDDGFVSIKDNAAPELTRRQIPWTIFIPSGCLGSKPEWLRQAHPAAQHDRVMTPEELRAVSGDPLVTIGSHTVRHANLVEAGTDQAKIELTRSKTDLENVLGKPVNQFSYPFGARNPELDRQARALGYERLFSTEPVFAFQAPGEFVTGRANVDPDTSPLEFRLKLLGAYRWQSVVRRWKTEERSR